MAYNQECKRLAHAFLTASQSKEGVVTNFEAIKPIFPDFRIEDSIGCVSASRLSLERLGGSSDGSAFWFKLGSRCSSTFLTGFCRRRAVVFFRLLHSDWRSAPASR